MTNLEKLWFLHTLKELVFKSQIRTHRSEALGDIFCIDSEKFLSEIQNLINLHKGLGS